MDKAIYQLEFEGNTNNNKEYKVKIICNNAIYINKSENIHLPGLYYFVL